VSQVLWCDDGSHAFPANDPNRRRYTEEVPYSEITGQPQTITLDICGEHAITVTKSLQAGRKAAQKLG
jgi:hypothetical protein